VTEGDNAGKYDYKGTTKWFSGTIDGDYHTISNMTVDNQTNFIRTTSGTLNTYAGLIARGNGCTVKNLGLIDVTLKANKSAAGFVAYGKNNITIENCFVRGTVTSDGGFANKVAFVAMEGNVENVTLTNCYCSTSNVYEMYNTNSKATFTNVSATNVYINRDLRTWTGYTKTNTLNVKTADEDGIETFINSSNGAFESDTYVQNGEKPVLAWENKFNIHIYGNNLVTLTNRTNTAVDGIIIVAGYKANDEMVDAAVLKDSNEQAVYSVDLAGKSQVTYTYDAVDGATYYKAFVWDGLTNLTPLCIAARYPAAE